MLSRDLGGIQQAFVDYSKALELQKFKVINIISVFAKVGMVDSIKRNCIKLPNFGVWDIFSILYLWLIIKWIKPDLIIAHGNRAITFSVANLVPLVGVAHNYSLKGLRKCDYVIALTKHMQQYLIQQNFESAKICLLPNMIDSTEGVAYTPYKQPMVVGTIARFVNKKGIDIFLQALAKLKVKNYQFKALIGGDGEERASLIELATELNLTQQVTFTGWIEDKKEFFNAIDIFCLPSRQEPFGIIVLEAMKYRTPIIATNTEGPREILQDGKDGLLCEVDASDLATKLAYLIDNPDKAHEYSKNGYLRLEQNYAINVVSVQLANFIQSIINK